jgi:hypothetical protein
MESKKAITTGNTEAKKPEVREHPPALTTNKIEPKPLHYPAEGKRRLAKGPLITTGNVEEIQAKNKAAVKSKK